MIDNCLSDNCFVFPEIWQITKACGNLFRISHIESMEWEMTFIATKELVFECGVEITYLQMLADRLESGDRTAINWIIVQLTTGLVVIGSKCFVGLT